MPWLQLKIQTNKDSVEAISDQLTDLGALSVTFQDAADQPLFEPPPGETPLWADTLITGLFEADSDIDSISESLRNKYALDAAAIRSEILEDKDWVREWMEHYKPMNFGHNLWIVPSHHSPPDPAAINILLDPGLAFGTGTHPTTAMCLRWLAYYPPVALNVIDYGCGSGILAIAAAKLGAKKVFAIDNDPQALIATRSNAENNEVTSKIECLGIEQPVPVQADCLLANILAGPLIELVDLFSEICRPGGTITLSGILQEQAESVNQAYSKFFVLDGLNQEGDWVLLTGKRKQD
ncbi:MAG: 50S ribosomal protein L11 methyltransferase [Thioalkalispiraceae bacterium]|jgi:ribosomal protein L11 methyltransferase